MSDRGGVFCTVQDTGGCFGLTDPDPQRAPFGGLAALARTAAREWPRAAVKAMHDVFDPAGMLMDPTMGTSDTLNRPV